MSVNFNHSVHFDHSGLTQVIGEPVGASVLVRKKFAFFSLFYPITAM